MMYDDLLIENCDFPRIRRNNTSFRYENSYLKNWGNYSWISGKIEVVLWFLGDGVCSEAPQLFLLVHEPIDGSKLTKTLWKSEARLETPLHFVWLSHFNLHESSFSFPIYKIHILWCSPWVVRRFPIVDGEISQPADDSDDSAAPREGASLPPCSPGQKVTPKSHG